MTDVVCARNRSPRAGEGILAAMHGFTHGGAHLVFQDGFGLTRVTFPKAVKTDRDIAGNLLTVGDAHALVHTQRTNRRALRTLPALARAKWNFSDFSEYVLMPDGERVVEVSNNGGKVFPAAGGSLGQFVLPEGMASVGRLDLGRDRPAKAYGSQRSAAGPGDVLAVFNPYARAVWAGRLTAENTVEPAWRAEVNVPVGEVLLFPSAAETLVGAWDPGTREARIYRVDGERRVEQKRLRSIVAPTFSGTRWCWQESDEVVCGAPWDALDRPDRHTLPAVAHGAGTLMAYGDRLYVVPLDGERVVDAVSGAVIDRKLGAGELSLRTKAIGALRTFGPWLGAEGGVLRFGHVGRETHGIVAWSPSFDVGLGTLPAHLAVGELLGRQPHVSGDRDELSVGSHQIPQGMARVTLDDVRRGFAALDACGGQLLRESCALEYPLKGYFEPPYNDRARRDLDPPAPLFDPLAGAAFLRAIMETARLGERVPLSENVDRWSATPITADELIGFEHPVEVGAPRPALTGIHSLPMITAWVALDLLRADAEPVLRRWLVDAPSPFAKVNNHIAHAPAARMVQYFPATEAAFRAACDGSGTQGASIWTNVERELRG